MLLADCRVIDLTTSFGWLAGRVLADLGADVIAVEPPGGHPDRRIGPFAGDVVDPEGSLRWWAHARGKRSVVLDPGPPGTVSPELWDLLAGADVLLESDGPCGLAARGVDLDELHRRHPRLVVTSISPFGLDGPYAHFRAPDLVLGALSGAVWLTGDVDRPPIRIGSEQFLGHASVEAVVHTLVALHHVRAGGAGQHVDVAAWTAAIRTAMNAPTAKMLEGAEFVRIGPGVAYQPGRAKQIYPCADGHVVYMAGPGPLAGPGFATIVEWAAAGGFAVPDILSGVDVTTISLDDLERDGIRVAHNSAVEAVCTAAFRNRTKAELYAHAVEHRWLLAPVNTAADLPGDRQLAAREFWDDVDHGRFGVVRHPGAWARPSTVALRAANRAPGIGEHTTAVLAEAHASAGAVALPDQPERPGWSPGAGALAGLKVWDMSWVGVGPLTARYLADHGATVVRLDSSVRADVLRAAPPFLDGVSGLNRSQFYGDFNASKLGIGLDLSTGGGREVALRLADWADVVIESFTPHTLRGLGLDHATLAARNPSLVMLSTCMQGQTGPNADYRGFGQLLAALSGFYEITGWPDRDPTMIYGAYTDFVCQRFCASVVLAALDRRRRTGEGTHIDLAQFEAALQFLEVELLDTTVNGRVPTRNGNRHHAMVPHGIYPSRRGPEAGLEGERWLAIACEDDAAWAALVEVMGAPAWATDPTLRTLDGRRAAEDRIDTAIAAWTATQEALDVFTRLQPRVAAAPVYAPGALLDDPHLAHLGFFVPLDHTVMGTVPYTGMQARLSMTPGHLRRAAPCVGEHSFEVLTEILGLDADAVGDLLASGAVEISVG
ncbi:MAG: CoA transferase [Actinobacteria bacterium]|nr:CoA transferase [Actinomycetota bacterium]